MPETKVTCTHVATKEEVVTACNIVTENIRLFENAFNFIEKDKIQEYFTRDVRESLDSARFSLEMLLEKLS